MRSPVICSLLIIALAGLPVHAEVPLLTPPQLERAAKHIVTGKVQRVYASEKALNKSYVDTLFAVEVTLSEIEKGKGMAPAQVIFAKAWRMKKREM